MFSLRTDIDEEIDDQCALEYIFRNLKAGDEGGDGVVGLLTIMLVGGKPVVRADAVIISHNRLQVFWEYFPEYANQREFKVGGVGGEPCDDGPVV